MSDKVWSRREPDSPCVKICVMDRDSGLCLGCKRTLDEIGAWSRMTPEARRAVMAELPTRGGAPKRRGGRAARIGKPR